MNNEGDRLLRIMNSILKHYDIEENINARQSTDDKIELIVEANDTILEKVGDNLDELNGIKKKNIQPVEFQMVTAQLPAISGSWNRINKAVFSVNSSTTSPVSPKFHCDNLGFRICVLDQLFIFALERRYPCVEIYTFANW